MINLQTNNAYSEVFELLKKLDRNDLDKIPMDLLKTIKKNRNENYIPKIDFDNLGMSMSKEARSLYVWLYLTYIEKDEERKNSINKYLYGNEINERKSIVISSDVFNAEKNNNTQQTGLIEVKKKNKIYQLVERIKKLLKKLKL